MPLRSRKTREPTPAIVARLFDGSAPVVLTDAELLARFVADRDEAAFEGLVARLGPMVLGVARRMLGDRAEADDAFQATFLVLVRRAGSVGRGDLIGPWLHGVAVRVCRKARARAARRQTRERTGLALAVDPPAPPADLAAAFDRADVRATIDAEIARLPEAYRRLVVLCDVEGLTRDEVADRLGWTPNMVRGRLARARSRLRANLSRRGCTPPGLAEGADWGPMPWLVVPPPAVLAATARLALASLSPPGRGVTLLASASALSLAQGVCQTMTLTSWKFVACGLLAAGTLAAGTAGALRAQAPAPADPQSPAAPRPNPAPPPIPGSIPPADASLQTLLEERLRTAQARLEAQQTFYAEGRITIDRLIDASHAVMRAKLGLAATPEQRRAAVRAHLGQVEEIFAKERRELEVGRATTADIAEAANAVNEARILLAQQDHERSAPSPTIPQPDPATPVVPPAVPPADASLRPLLERRLQTAQKRFDGQASLFRNARIELDRVIDASQQLLQAKLGLAATPEQRRAAIRGQLGQVEEILAVARQMRDAARGTDAGVAEAEDAVNQARILLARNEGGASVEAPSAAPVDPPARPAAVVPAPGMIADLRRGRVESARRLFAEAERLFPVELPTSEYLAARRDLFDAELAAATTAEGRASAYGSMIAATRRAMETVEESVRRGERRPSDASRLRMALLELQARAAEDAAGANPATADLDRRLTTLERKVDQVLDILSTIPGKR